MRRSSRSYRSAPCCNKCPDERSGVDGKLVAEGLFKLVGEYGEWYEYEGKAGRFGYFRKAGVTMRASPERTVAGANGSQPSTSGGATSGSTVATEPSGGIAVATSTEVSPGQVTAPPGVEYEKTRLPCPKSAAPGKAPAFRPMGADANVYVPEEFDMTNDAMVKQVLLFGAERYRQDCGATDATIRVFPRSDKSFVAGDSGNPGYRADGTTVLVWARGSAKSVGQLSHYENEERDRIRDCASVTDFYKRTKAQELDSGLTKNPLASQGKIVRRQSHVRENGGF